MWHLITKSQLTEGATIPTKGLIVEDRYFNRGKGVGFKRMLQICSIIEERKEDKERGLEEGWLCEVKELRSVRLVPRRG